jgi:mannitol/fructose-specific phosphotransferase system IIA component (Ntr-type)
MSRAKSAVLRELVALLPSVKTDELQEQVLACVLEREAKMSTGIGQGVAIPHGRSELISDMEVALGISPVPVEFNSMDGQPVQLFFLIVTSPSETGAHIQALARISRLLASASFRKGLIESKSAEEALELLRREESPQKGAR